MSENDQAGAVGQARPPAPGPSELTRLAAWLAAAAIVASVLIMVVVSAAGPNVSVPLLPATSGPPWWHHSLHLTATFVTVSLWVAMVLGCAGVIAGLVTVDRGARLPVRAVVTFAFLATAVFTLLPPAGSTDAISYAASGRTAVIGHSPYVMTPLQLERSGDPIGRQIPFAEIPSTWSTTVSVYGPVATGAEWAAAELGGTSLARITFWLKLEEALAFGVVIAALDRMLRRESGLRLRAHLLWSVNPLLLWEIVAGGHIDGLAAVFGLLGVAALRVRDGRLSVGAAAVAGVATGVAAGVKVEYLLVAVGLAWACRRAVRPLAAAAAGFLLVVVPAYVAAGLPAIKILITRSPGVTWDTMYQLFWRPVLGYTQFSASSAPPHLALVAYLLFGAAAVLALLRMPDRVPARPAVTPALALSLAWLFFTAFQRPWYDVMAVSLLALYSASLLDWAVLIRLLAGALIYAQAVQSPAEPHWLYDIGQFNGAWLVPGVRLAAAAALVWLCVSGRWGWRSRPVTPADQLPELLPLA